MIISDNLLDICDKIISSRLALEELGDIVRYTTNVLIKSYENRVLSDKKVRDLLQGVAAAKNSRD